MNNVLHPCHACGNTISAQTLACPRCGHPAPRQALSNSEKERTLVVLRVLVLLLTLGSAMYGAKVGIDYLSSQETRR
jgi:uncharacterized paraquat-inducible protein A